MVIFKKLHSLQFSSYNIQPLLGVNIYLMWKKLQSPFFDFLNSFPKKKIRKIVPRPSPKNTFFSNILSHKKNSEKKNQKKLSVTLFPSDLRMLVHNLSLVP